MGTGMSWWDDLFGRRRARPGSEYTFLEIYLRKTQERFESAWKEIEESHISRVRKGEEDHNWDDHKAVADFRLELIKAGWLPPREKDALARTGKKAGLWLANKPCKWSYDRRYEMEELPHEVRRYHPDHPDNNDPYS